MAVRLSVSFEDGSAALLQRVGGRSRYLSALVEQRWRASQHTLAWLRDEGWSLARLREAMDVLSGTWEQGVGGSDSEQPQRALAAQWPTEDIDERVCRALCLLAGEWWAHNGALRQQMSEAPAKPVRKRAAVSA